jgi:hypothetical protein
MTSALEWTVPAGSEWYYLETKAPSDNETLLTALLPSRDATRDSSFGRLDLPYSPDELALRDKYHVVDRQICTDKRLKTRTSGDCSLRVLPHADWSASCHR